MVYHGGQGCKKKSVVRLRESGVDPSPPGDFLAYKAKKNQAEKYLYKKNHSKWKIFFDLEVKNNGESTILTGNLNRKDINIFYCFGDSFLKEIIEILSELNYEQYITSKEQL